VNVASHLVNGCSHQPLHQQVAHQPWITINKRPAAAAPAAAAATEEQARFAAKLKP
jgi:hypothetical protein